MGSKSVGVGLHVQKNQTMSEKHMSFIGLNPPSDGQEWEPQCARCGSSTDFTECGQCGGDGFTSPGELYEEDPLWYDPDDVKPCCQCGGDGGWTVCISSFDYCNLNPIPGRIEIARGQIEWFAIKERRAN